jgi:hypothetical protein
MPLYEIAVIQKPSKKEAEEGAIEKLLVAPRPIMARDPLSAAMGAGRELDPSVDLNKIEVLVRSFGPQ